jgi:hypothetical protein
LCNTYIGFVDGQGSVVALELALGPGVDVVIVAADVAQVHALVLLGDVVAVEVLPLVLKLADLSLDGCEKGRTVSGSQVNLGSMLKT